MCNNALVRRPFVLFCLDEHSYRLRNPYSPQFICICRAMWHTHTSIQCCCLQVLEPDHLHSARERTHEHFYYPVMLGLSFTLSVARWMAASIVYILVLCTLSSSATSLLSSSSFRTMAVQNYFKCSAISGRPYTWNIQSIISLRVEPCHAWKYLVSTVSHIWCVSL